MRVALGTGWGRAGVVAPETLAGLTGSPEPHAVWIRATTGADAARLGSDLDVPADPAGATIENGLRTWESLDGSPEGSCGGCRRPRRCCCRWWRPCSAP
ncbi:hypothetical protein GCM10023334_013420 [Nonomuraea thailandensis]